MRTLTLCYAAPILEKLISVAAFEPMTMVLMSYFFNPNHDYCVAETGYLADKADPSATDREYSMLGS